MILLREDDKTTNFKLHEKRLKRKIGENLILNKMKRMELMLGRIKKDFFPADSSINNKISKREQQT